MLPTACDFTVFGGTGDLALRKLLPALYHRDLRGPAARRHPDHRRLALRPRRRRLPRRGPRRRSTSHVDAADLYDGRGRPVPRPACYHLTLDADDPEDWHRCHALLKDRPHPDEAVRVFYLAVAPEALRLDLPAPRRDRRRRRARPRGAGEADRPRPRLGPRGQRRRRPGLRRVADLPDRPLPRQGERPEPPGHALRQHLPRAAVELALGRPRADHRRRDRSGSASRGDYYDHAGALRDMVQNHLLQLLCLVAMEPPTYVGRETVRDEKLKVLQALRADGARRTSTATPSAAATAPGSSTASPCRRTPTTSATPGPHRDLRGPQGRGAELALGRGAVLPAHRQADGPTGLRDRGGLQGAAALDVPRQRGRRPRPTGCTSWSSPTRACACT